MIFLTNLDLISFTSNIGTRTLMEDTVPRFEIQYAGGMRKTIEPTEQATAMDYFEGIWADTESFEEGGVMPMKLIMIEVDGDEEVETVVIDLNMTNTHA